MPAARLRPSRNGRRQSPISLNARSAQSLVNDRG
jgi:hypothetical protein